jgi:hypothetical protein
MYGENVTECDMGMEPRAARHSRVILWVRSASSSVFCKRVWAAVKRFPGSVNRSAGTPPGGPQLRRHVNNPIPVHRWNVRPGPITALYHISLLYKVAEPPLAFNLL